MQKQPPSLFVVDRPLGGTFITYRLRVPSSSFVAMCPYRNVYLWHSNLADVTCHLENQHDLHWISKHRALRCVFLSSFCALVACLPKFNLRAFCTACATSTLSHGLQTSNFRRAACKIRLPFLGSETPQKMSMPLLYWSDWPYEYESVIWLFSKSWELRDQQQRKQVVGRMILYSATPCYIAISTSKCHQRGVLCRSLCLTLSKSSCE